MMHEIRSELLPLLRVHWRLVLLVLLGVLGPLILVAHVTDEIFREGGYAWDQAILAWYAAHRTPALTSAARDLAVIGGVGVLPVITLVLALLLAHYRSRAHAWFLVLAVAGATVINVLAKVAFQRPRPDQLVSVLVEPGYSFPSGHTMANAAFGIALGLVFWKGRWGWPVTLLGWAWAILIGVSRNYLGVHYPTDVMVGFLSSVAWVVGLYLVVRRRWTVLAAPEAPANPHHMTSPEGNAAVNQPR
ncbi:undecaprenyl-diphosphatase [Deinococcus metalli]|uniref:Phosphatidylglycerophosphatase n=1 Tax=Deinococcus metalli TaxID=1141878 RepID=A0A7W8KE02_9DEIO|nr:phosphatase PAP2 family protein [Deinococcus metalli]MBB5375301.1 undecaprenyl-diphosphatase [Deinococcus metalli]GHF30255.1 phosphatidylglycerophosphatase [Deinococcus metalli]